MFRMIELNNDSLGKIIGNSNEIVMAGFGDCDYYETVYQNLPSFIKAYNFFNLPFKKIEDLYPKKLPDIESEDNVKRLGKAAFTQLIIENAKRVREGKPVIPLLMFIGLESDKKKIVLDIKKIATSHSHNHENTTDSELRRCYKIFNEMSDAEIRELASKTFKFVKINVSEDKVTLEEIKPFWSNENWCDFWNSRKHQHEQYSTAKAIFPKWRDVLSSNIKGLK